MKNYEVVRTKNTKELVNHMSVRSKKTQDIYQEIMDADSKNKLYTYVYTTYDRDSTEIDELRMMGYGVEYMGKNKFRIEWAHKVVKNMCA